MRDLESDSDLQATIIGTPIDCGRRTPRVNTGATHCFICTRLVAVLGLPLSGQPGPLSVATAAAGGAQGLGAPVLIHLSLGDVFREAMSISPMDMDVGEDLILGWDWISSHDLQNLFQAGHVGLRSGRDGSPACPVSGHTCRQERDSDRAQRWPSQ